MHLYIAEKPSLGRAIAAALPGPHQKGQGWIRCGNGDNAATVLRNATIALSRAKGDGGDSPGRAPHQRAFPIAAERR